MTLIAKLSLLILLVFPFSSLAAIPVQLTTDFEPISGTIIMPIGEEYLVDLDASVNLQVGDILTLIMAGEKVIHPITKETLGTLDLAKGYLQVTQIKSGYSYVKLLSAEVSPKKGDRVKRFEQTPTRFESSQPSGKLAEELKIALPHLNWLSDSDKTNPELIFFLADNSLKIINSAGVELKTYPYHDGQLTAQTTVAQTPDIFQLKEPPQKNKSLLNQAVSNLTGSISIGKKDKRLENPGIIQNQQQQNGIWIGQNLDGNPVGVAVADFDGDGQLETAVAMEDHLQILRMTNNKLVPVATINFAKSVHLLSLDTVDIDSNGTPEIYLSANVGKKLSSQVVEFKQGSYQSTISRIPWFFRTVDLPQEGRTLIAQSMGDSENPFFGQPFRVIRSENELIQGTSIPLPERINLFSFVPFQGTNNDSLYAYISEGDYLHVKNPQGDTIWDSADHFGGTEVSFYNGKQTGTSKDELIQPVYIQQRLLTLPSGEILAAQNEGFRSLNRYRNFNKSRVVALSWNGFAFQEKWKTSAQAGYLADFTLADADNDGQDELVMAIKFQQKNLLQKGRSTVVIYELN
ncbi:VCBS repeat-containing protein [uncultured Desulfuromusa sp.]|uniref:FG-GAP repeat domain-containing protein n=1 Tax=uncultured Desulfuromusa sp. TaxID=219183 RepID=UPI002AA6BBE1|nr:VCBS repeat-containing protein [uncultured Desulfuromusa sp.]